MSRFIRDYQIQIRLSQNEGIEINPPFRVVFKATKSITEGINKLDLQIYNLGDTLRKRIFKDKTETINNQFDTKYFQVILKAGYETKIQNQKLLPKIIFKGNIWEAFTEKNETDFITHITIEDGGFGAKNSFTATTVTNQDTAIDTLVKDLKNIDKGNMTLKPDQIVRGKVLVGNTLDLLNIEAGNDKNLFIDNEQIFITKEDEVKSLTATQIDATTGLLGVPSRADKMVTAITLMNPDVELNGLVNLESKIIPALNGIYKVETIVYEGDNYSNKWQQTLTLRLPRKSFKVVA